MWKLKLKWNKWPLFVHTHYSHNDNNNKRKKQSGKCVCSIYVCQSINNNFSTLWLFFVVFWQTQTKFIYDNYFAIENWRKIQEEKNGCDSKSINQAQIMNESEQCVSPISHWTRIGNLFPCCSCCFENRE